MNEFANPSCRLHCGVFNIYIILIILLSGGFRIPAGPGGEVSGVEEIMQYKPVFTRENTVFTREDKEREEQRRKRRKVAKKASSVTAAKISTVLEGWLRAHFLVWKLRQHLWPEEDI